MRTATPALPLPAPIELAPPSHEGSLSVLGALHARRTIREFRAAPLTHQQLANLLWAACGINRPSGPYGVAGRTAGSASNSQEIDIYVALADGIYRYDAALSQLLPVVAGDFRFTAISAGQRGMIAKAPVQLIYVVDVDRLVHTRGYQEPGLTDPEVQKAYYYVDVGLIAENVYLFAAATGLAAWFHNCDRAAFAEHLKLRPQQRVLFAQSVGHPA